MTILGKPNAGKSSLLNAILNEERAIVTDIEGTTRDIIEEYIVIDGIPVKVIDTAGIRNKTDDKIEEIGINKAKEMAKKADLIVYIIDSAKEINEEDLNLIEEFKDKKIIIVLNKSDLNMITEEKMKYLGKYNVPIIKISALRKEGIETLYNEISRLFKFGEIQIDDTITITNERHKELILKSIECANEAISSVEMNMPVDIITVSAKQILDELGKITGATASEDIINEIFKKFCLGK